MVKHVRAAALSALWTQISLSFLAGRQKMWPSRRWEQRRQRAFLRRSLRFPLGSISSSSELICDKSRELPAFAGVMNRQSKNLLLTSRCRSTVGRSFMTSRNPQRAASQRGSAGQRSTRSSPHAER